MPINRMTNIFDILKGVFPYDSSLTRLVSGGLAW